MTIGQFLLCLSCVCAISVGQLLFKKAGLQLAAENSWINASFLVTVGLAAVVYGLATLLWIYLLKDIPLNRAYMTFALSFVLVPLASAYIYGERLSIGYFAGTALILVGLFVIFQSDSPIR
ncbi:MAG: EamA family transporter [Halieaceae bacterium]|jgi:drug/metabolite transporter (DMT)-like permease|nr:EamA family transporter [Halieaceae bacterium]